MKRIWLRICLILGRYIPILKRMVTDELLKNIDTQIRFHLGLEKLYHSSIKCELISASEKLSQYEVAYRNIYENIKFCISFKYDNGHIQIGISFESFAINDVVIINEILSFYNRLKDKFSEEDFKTITDFVR